MQQPAIAVTEMRAAEEKNMTLEMCGVELT
jgi:hypothetical protein